MLGLWWIALLDLSLQRRGSYALKDSLIFTLRSLSIASIRSFTVSTVCLSVCPSNKFFIIIITIIIISVLLVLSVFKLSYLYSVNNLL